MDLMQFYPRNKYTLVPRKWTYRYSLGIMWMIERYSSLHRVVEFARKRSDFGETDFGCGIEYPTRPDRQGYVRFWRWNWNEKSKVKTRKFHVPEADYLAVLAARLRLEGWHAELEQIAAMADLPPVELLPVPDPYDVSNYGITTWLPQINHALRLILEQENFDLAAQRAHDRQGFVVADGSGVSYLSDGTIALNLPHGRTVTMLEADYLQILQAARIAARDACKQLEDVLAQRKANDANPKL